MVKRFQLLLAGILTLSGLVGQLLITRGGISPAAAQSASSEVLVMSSRGQPIDHMTDGDEIRLRLVLPEKTELPVEVVFNLAGLDVPIEGCTIDTGSDRCQTRTFASLGWHWDPGGIAVDQRAVEARADGQLLGTSEPIPVASRPVVMVHGFSSDWHAWENYLGPQGYLASIGIQGFAVGDGQLEGVMNTGRLDQPTGRTNTIAENAAILGQYIDAVKKKTGAQKVDLLGHSMGGLISRFYIDRLMGDSGVGQLIMLGSPMTGTGCANLPAALGYYLPAVLEIRPSYVGEIFNAQITHRHGIPFYALAGVSILEALKSPCTPIPSDLAVSQNSVDGIPLHLSTMDVLHIDLNTSPRVFDEYVAHLLQTPPGGYPSEPDPALAPSPGIQEQFSRTFSGHLAPGESQELTIFIDSDVAVASFALFNPSRSLDVTVRGASGNVIQLDPVANGLTVIDDPKMLFQLGYGFNNPKPGVWKVTLLANDKTPPSGADYALTAQFQGGARLQAQAIPLLPVLGEEVTLSAQLDKNGQPMVIQEAEANITQPDGSQQTIPLSTVGNAVQAQWRAEAPGLYGVELRVSGLTPEGIGVDRAAFFTIEAQPRPASPYIGLAVLCVILVAILALNLWVFAILIRKRRLKNQQT